MVYLNGLALGSFLPKISKLMNNNVDDIIDRYSTMTFDLSIDIDMVIDEAVKYDKICESNIFMR